MAAHRAHDLRHGLLGAWLLALLMCLTAGPARAGDPPAPLLTSASQQGPGDDFRRSDPQERELAPVAESSGLERLTAVQPRAKVLTLAEVVSAVEARDPRLAAAQAQIEAAQGRLLSARGGFDPVLGMRGLMQPLGYYQNGVVDVRVKQATPLWGLGVWAGWRLGFGEFPVYDGKLLTADAGELRAGVTLPVWRGGPIDRTRADIRQAAIGEDRALLVRDARQLELELEAARAYWSWVAAGLELEIERSLLQIALERDAGLRRQIELGSVEALAGTDNRRLILDREARVVGAERDFQQAVLELSLFLRNGVGEPVLAGAERLPLVFPDVTPPAIVDIDAEIEAAIERRPDLAAVLASREQAGVELRLAKNLLGPGIELSAWVAKDLGDGPARLLPFEAIAAIEIDLPIPLRKARGQVQIARAELTRINAELRFAADRIAVDVRDAHSAVAAAFQRARLAGEQVELARVLAGAELRRFNLGGGDLLLVNLRELATATAARAQVEALESYFVAQAQLDVARGQPVRLDQSW